MLSNPLGERALVIDGNMAVRRTTVSQLRELGLQDVQQCRGLAEARLALELQAFDFVLCADEIEGSRLNGQVLLEELRREALLPHRTVFMMLAAEVTYAQVVEAAESSLDAFLLRPYKLNSLAERMAWARDRKLTLADIFDALHEGRHGQAVSMCMQRYVNKQSFGPLCARMAGEVLLKLGRTDDALELFQRVAAESDASWAQLGISRARFAAGDAALARKELEALLRKDGTLIEAYDALGGAQVDQGDLAEALQTYKRAIELTPGCNLRLQHGGATAFYEGKRELAAEYLQRAVSIGTHSRLFDAFTLLLLCFVRHDQADARRVATIANRLEAFALTHPESRRLQRFRRAANAVVALQAKQWDEALSIAQGLADEAAEDDFDLEAANVVLALWTRLPTLDVDAGEQDRLGRAIGLRFGVSKALTEILVASAQRQEAFSLTLRNSLLEINAIVETAMQGSLDGRPGEAVHLLLEKGAQTGNARLIEVAAMVLDRHRDRVSDADAVQLRIVVLKARYCRPYTHIAGIRRSGRSPGGLMLRVPRSASWLAFGAAVQTMGA